MEQNSHLVPNVLDIWWEKGRYVSIRFGNMKGIAKSPFESWGKTISDWMEEQHNSRRTLSTYNIYYSLLE